MHRHVLIEIIESSGARTVQPRRAELALDLAECLSHLDIVGINVLVYEGTEPNDQCVGIWHWRDTDPHSASCPGWYLGRDGTVEACAECGVGDLDAYNRARAFFREHDVVRHEPNDECPGCPGYDVFTCEGSVTCAPISVLREDYCGVYDRDAPAVLAARAVYVAAGYHLIDGVNLPAEDWKRP